MDIKIDFNEIIGQIKPVNGVGQPPFVGIDFSMCDYLKKANIPYSRLHDVGGAYGRNVFVDIPNLFRDFSKDPQNPENYDFAFTDLLITALVERGIEPFFRLGVTIENYRAVKAYNIDPPADYDKWARICEGVIRHYTQGWANGFNYKITYWEIWNEPDNNEDPDKNPMWTGDRLDYYRLYQVTSKHLKATFPQIKIGGYASCGFYALTLEENNFFGIKMSTLNYYIDYFIGFLEYIKAQNCPIDFFSWHSYADIKDNIVWAKYVREQLDKYGYTHCEHILNEWNSQPQLKGTIKHAALTCGMLLALQNTSLNSAMFYDARCGMGNYSGLFNCMTYQPLPAYYSFVAFGKLYQRKDQVSVSQLPDNVYCCAANGNNDGCLVIANTNDEDIDMNISVTKYKNVKECRIIKEDNVWGEYCFNGHLPANSVIMIIYE